jgi:hypothetical protein
MPIEELLLRLKTIWIWSPKHSTVRTKVAELIQNLGGIVPQEYSEPQGQAPIVVPDQESN